MSWIKVSNHTYIDSSQIDSIEITDDWASVGTRSGRKFTAVAGTDGYAALKAHIAEVMA